MSDHDTTDDTDAQRRSDTAGAGTLAGLLLGGVFGWGAVGTASADPQGQVGRSGDPLTALYTNELNGGVTGNTSLTGLTGDGLTVSSNALSAAPARPDVDDGTTSVADAAGLTFGSGFTLTDDGDDTVTVGLDTRYREGPKLVASDGDKDDWFGSSVALSGDGTTALVGAPSDELSDTDSDTEGAAYVFADDGSSWSQVTKLLASDGDKDDRFGSSVALSGDGTTALVGARLDDNSKGTNAGAAYVFANNSGWSQVTKLLASDGDDNDEFGSSVALSGDGTTALVGAYKDDNSKGTDAGAAYVFDGSSGWGSVTNETTKLVASDGDSSDRFGNSVGLSDDGSTALVGAPETLNTINLEPGSAYVFDGSSGWTSITTETTKLDAGVDNDEFGYSVALSDDGTTGLVGARFDDSKGRIAGSAYVYYEAL